MQVDPIGPVTPAQAANVQPTENSLLRTIGTGLGYVWSAITFIPRLLISLIAKVCQAAADCFTQKTEEAAPLTDRSISEGAVPPDCTEVFDAVVAPAPEPRVRRRKQKKPIEKLPVKAETVIEQQPPKPAETQRAGPPQEEVLLEESMSDIETMEDVVVDPDRFEPAASVKAEPEDSKEAEKEQAAPVEAAESVVMKEPVANVKEPRLIDVPDDGNCLFYAIALGLTAHNSSEVKQKADFQLDANDIEPGTPKFIEALKGPGAKLRETAAATLLEKQYEDEILFSLFSGITDHHEVSRKTMEEAQSAIYVLEQDIQQLENWRDNRAETQAEKEGFQRQIDQKAEQMQKNQADIAFELDNMPNDGNLEAYIEMSKKDGFYGGMPQVMALAKHFDIPIQVILEYNTPQARTQMFNPTSKHEPITIAHVNGNHFQVIAAV